MRALIFFLSVSWSLSDGSRVHRRDKELSMLTFTDDYTFLDPPEGSPLNVSFQINLRNVLEVNEIHQTISLETTIRMYWKDPRVTLSSQEDDYRTFNPELLGGDVFWIPDVFLDGTKDLRTPKFQLVGSSLRVYRDSTLRFASRVNFDAFCPMWFHWFPNDSQECNIRLESFGFTTDRIMYSWAATGNDINQNISLPHFDFSVDMNDSYNTSQLYSLSYPGVSLRIRLRRKLTYHVLQTYIPSVMLFTLSWFSLFIPIEETPGRVGMCTMSLVTLMALYGVTRKEVPRVSYMSLLDLWMFTTMAFIVLILFHYVILAYTVSKHYKKSHTDILDALGRWGISSLFIAFCCGYWGLFML